MRFGYTFIGCAIGCIAIPFISFAGLIVLAALSNTLESLQQFFRREINYPAYELAFSLLAVSAIWWLRYRNRR